MEHDATDQGLHQANSALPRGLAPAFDNLPELSPDQRSGLFADAVRNWLTKSGSAATRNCYERDLRQFLAFAGINLDELALLAAVRPEHIAAWRDSLKSQGNANPTIRRKLTAVRSLFSYLQLYGYLGANPAHGKFVAIPPASRDGKTPGLTPEQCRALLDAPDNSVPVGVRDRALLATLAYSACRVGELVRLRVGDLSTNGGHHVLRIHGKGGKDRIIALHPEAVERIEQWIAVAGIASDSDGALFRPSWSPQKKGQDGFRTKPLTVRSVEKLTKKYTRQVGLSNDITVHSLRVTALTTAREQGSDIVALQDFAGHSDPRTTMAYIRNRQRLSNAPTYVLRY